MDNGIIFFLFIADFLSSFWWFVCLFFVLFLLHYVSFKLLWIRLQDSAFLSEVAVNHLKKVRGEIWPKLSEEETTHKKKKYQDEDKKSAINKKKIILRLRSLISK